MPGVWLGKQRLGVLQLQLPLHSSLFKIAAVAREAAFLENPAPFNVYSGTGWRCLQKIPTWDVDEQRSFCCGSWFAMTCSCSGGTRY
eukprot:5288050-Amphidinium_carterae.1